MPLTAADRDAVAAEGAALLGFLHPDAAPDVRLVEEPDAAPDVRLVEEFE
ncbi:hypothetical protein ACIBEF_31440 [Micromonospora sp. NPDC050795]